jgi:hypothetical protein
MATVYKKVISALDVAADIVGEENEFRDVRDLSNDQRLPAMTVYDLRIVKPRRS